MTKDICRRLVVIFDLVGLDGDTHLSKELGYKNSTTIHKVRRGLTLLGPQKLARLAELDIANHFVADLHWILTGRGPAVRLKGTQEMTNAVAALTRRANVDARDVEFEKERPGARAAIQQLQNRLKVVQGSLQRRRQKRNS